MLANGAPPTRIYVIVATTGRALEAATLIRWLAEGAAKPDFVLVIGCKEADIVGIARQDIAVETMVATRPGLPRQRNEAVARLRRDREVNDSDLIVFFDDDFRPDRDWLTQAATAFHCDPSIVALTGTVVRDGAKSAALSEQDAERELKEWRHSHRGECDKNTVPSLYGCNMAMRAGLFAHCRFDERLPLYGWLEDLDFSGQAAKFGRVVKIAAAGGVHLASKSGRVSGRRYGYSQIVNPLYLALKGTCPRHTALALVLRSLASNLLRTPLRHPIFDYAGRLRGNLRALRDVVSGRIDPEAILVM